MEWTGPSQAELLIAGDERAFEQVFKTYFKNLHAYASTILKDIWEAEEMVQQVFYKLWEKRSQIDIHTSLKGYLYRSVHNECMNHIKHKKVKAVHRQYAMYDKQEIEKTDPAHRLTGSELEKNIHHALNELPEQCRAIFQMSRFEALKYHEIAFQLGISVKTVESQMGKALKRLRLKLVEYLPVLIPTVLYILNLLP